MAGGVVDADPDPVGLISPFRIGAKPSAPSFGSWNCLKLSKSNIPNPMPAPAKSFLIASLTAARRSLVRMSARAMMGSTFTLAERRRIAAISASGNAARLGSGAATGSSMMECSERLPALARGRAGVVTGGMTWSGSKKYIQLGGST